MRECVVTAVGRTGWHIDGSFQPAPLLTLSPGFYTPEMGIETREIHRVTADGS